MFRKGIKAAFFLLHARLRRFRTAVLREAFLSIACMRFECRARRALAAYSTVTACRRNGDLICALTIGAFGNPLKLV